MKVVILTEGGDGIGLGHLSRCCALYDAFEEKNCDAQLIVDGTENLRPMLAQRNFKFLPWRDRETPVSQVTGGADIVVIDSYLAEQPFYEAVANNVSVGVFLDDYFRLSYPRGIVVNASRSANNFPNPDSESLFLLGPQYAMLRACFQDPQRETKEEIQSVLITVGQNDPKGLLPKLISFLNKNVPQLERIVLAGESTEKQVYEMYQKVDLAISGGGQTVLELACMGVPTIAICLSYDQVGNLTNLKNQEAVIYAGSYDDEAFFPFIKEAIIYLRSKEIRQALSEKSTSVIDGQGAHRVAAAAIERFRAQQVQLT